jgi:hypothetical protein
MLASVLKGQAAGAGAGKAAEVAAEDKPAKPTVLAAITSLVLLAVGVLVALLDKGDEFTPRVETLDALAGLAIGAFVVDRLLTFAPPILASGARGNGETPDQLKARIKQRAADVAFLRVGYGALFGGIFVMLTDLRAVKVLTEDDGATVSAGFDRVIATLAIAGGVAGLASLLGGLNPQPATDPAKAQDSDGPAGDPPAGGPPAPAVAAAGGAAPADAPAPEAPPGGTPPTTPAATEAVPPANDAAYVFGIVALIVAALIALLGADDTTGLELIGPAEPVTPADGTAPAADDAGSTVELVVRFGLVILLAGVIQEVVERLVAPFVEAKENKRIVTGGVALVLGVAAAWLTSLFLLHNVGFFGVGADETINEGLAASSDMERWFDTLITGVAIAAGTKPLHDLSSALKKRTEKEPATTPAAAAAA